MGLLADYMPDWLPDDPAKNAAMRQGLLSLGATMLGGRGNFGQMLGQGLQTGAAGYQGSLAAQQAAALQDAQAKHFELENQKLQGEIDEPMKLAEIARGMSPTSAAPQLGGDSAPVAALPQIGSVPQTSVPATGGVMPLSSLPQMSKPGDAQADTPAPQAPQQAAPAQSQSQFEYYSALSRAYAGAGKTAAAKTAADIADKFKPKYATDFRVAMGPDGKPHNYMLAEDGTFKDAGLGVKPDMVSTDVGGKVIWNDKNALQPGASFDKTATPGEIMQDATARRGQNMAHQDNADSSPPITDAAILNAAARYNLDGTLPPMGMGANAAAGRSAILNKAAELATGVDPTDQRRNQLVNKNDIASQGKAIKDFTSGKLGNTVRSFNVLQSHLDTFGNMADALNNGNMPVFNKLANMVSTQTGQAAPTNFEAIKHIVGDEIVKAVTGSAGALGDREAAAKTIASANSPAQLRGVINTYKELARGQINGLQQQYETSTGKKDFNRFLSPNAQDSRAIAPVSSLPKKSVPPPDINNLLTKYGKP